MAKNHLLSLKNRPMSREKGKFGRAHASKLFSRKDAKAQRFGAEKLREAPFISPKSVKILQGFLFSLRLCVFA